MKKFLSLIALCGAIGFAAPGWAEEARVEAAPAVATEVKTDAAPAAAVLEAPAAAPVAAVAEAAPEAAPAAAPAPAINKGDNAFLMMSAAFVILMSIPGLALFYGGLVRAKNMLSVLMQVFAVFSLISVLWVVYGYSVAFTEGNAFFGSFGKVLLKGVTPESLAATWSKGIVVSEMIYVVFQGADRKSVV